MKTKQCKSKHFLAKLQCQGVKGHSGQHWCYRGNGWLEQWKRKKDITGPMDTASSSTPPDHKMYIHPKDMTEVYYKTIISEEIERLREKSV